MTNAINLIKRSSYISETLEIRYLLKCGYPLTKYFSKGRIIFYKYCIIRNNNGEIYLQEEQNNFYNLFKMRFYQHCIIHASLSLSALLWSATVVL